MRKSTQQTAIKGLKLNPMKKALVNPSGFNGIISLQQIFQDVTDIDYDFPTSSNDHEFDEYDEPQPVINEPEDEEQPYDDRDMDYDNPVTRYKQIDFLRKYLYFGQIV